MSHHVQLAGASVGELDRVALEADDAALVNEFGVFESHGRVSTGLSSLSPLLQGSFTG